MKHNHIAAAKSKMPQPIDDTLGFVQQIRDEYHEAALTDAVRQQVERLGDVGAAAEGQRVERRGSTAGGLDVRWPAASR